MYWLKVNKSFYNLELITKISYCLKNDKNLAVEIFYSGVNKAEKLKGVEAARFLDAISRQDGCWAFSYPADDARRIQALLNSPKQEEEKDKGQVEEKGKMTTTKQPKKEK